MNARDPAGAAPAVQAKVSFVIPARNEERFLPGCLAAIRDAAAGVGPYEVVVVDHGSTDRTARIAEQMGARLLVKNGGSIAAARNLGARSSTGSVIVFLDADVRLTPMWAREAPRFIHSLADDPGAIVGSWVGVSRSPGWIESHWFQPLESKPHRHVNSAHMIVGRRLFDRLGGFDESLETGEDYDISRRAAAIGARIVNEPALKVIHEGYPKTLRGFFRRELWHGRGDWASPAAVLSSRVLLTAFVLAAMHAAFLVSALNGSWAGALASAGAALGVCLAAAVAKYWPAPARALLVNTGLFYVYFVARLAAWMPVWLHRR
jgi:glycosyltransferase involved in cell wall biosynthesis